MKDIDRQMKRRLYSAILSCFSPLSWAVLNINQIGTLIVELDFNGFGADGLSVG